MRGRGMLAMAAAMSLGATAILREAVRFTGEGQPVDSLPYFRTPGPGYTVAHVKRMKAKRRNRLRAKRQFRKAVH